MKVKIGILSDTHLTTTTPQFQELARLAFSDCEIIIHAGDITNCAILDTFSEKTVHAVHGNMCSTSTLLHFPQKKLIRIGNYTIGLCHGTGLRYNIEDRMWALFPETDCIIYGHTHQPVCEKKGNILFINPGSFQYNGAFGAPASYAILHIDDYSLHANLHTMSLG
jgi:putative phosphoesterase